MEGRFSLGGRQLRDPLVSSGLVRGLVKTKNSLALITRCDILDRHYVLSAYEI
jgi:hypothetical protein